MNDIKDRFRIFDEIEPPDLWPEAERRVSRPQISTEARPIHRLAIALLAFAVAIAGLALVVQAIGGRGAPQPTGTVTNGRIAFSALSGGTWQIFSVAPDGSGLTQLTHVTDAIAESPAWSPDGTQIAYQVRENGGSGPTKVWVMNADGSDPRQLIEGAGSYWGPAWSPDGTRIAFAHREPTNLYVVNPDGTDLTKVTKGNLGPAYLSWSPDGSKIVFGEEGEVQHLYVVNADGTGLRTLVDRPGRWQNFPAWSPDGSTIAFTASNAQGGGFGIYAVKPDGTDLRKLSDQTAGPSQSPAWSPDGTQIVFMANPPGPTTHATLYLMNANGTDVREISGLPRGASEPSWQPIPVGQTSVPSRSGSPSAVISSPASVPLSVTGVLTLSSTPFGVALDHGSLWIASYGQVLRVDPDRMLVTRTIPLPHLGDQDSIAAGADVWATVEALHEVVRIDPTSGAIAGRVHLAGYPTQVAASGQDVWVVSVTNGDGLLSHIDATTGSITSRTRLTASPNLGIVATPGSVWVSQPGGLLHVSADGSSSTLSGVGFGSLTWPLAFGAGSLWASNGGEVFRIDPASGSVLAQIKVAAVRLAFADGKVWVLTDTGSKSRTLYIPNPKHPSTILYIDPGTNRIEGFPVAVGLLPMWLTAGDGSGWVVEFNTGRLERVSPG